MEYKINGQLIEISNAKILWKNFTGELGFYNKEGGRNFCLVLSDDASVNFFKQNGYSVAVKSSGVEVGEFIRYLKVKLKFNNGKPIITLKSNNKTISVDGNLISVLDSIKIKSVDMSIKPYHWELPNGENGQIAYLSNMTVYQ